MRKLTILIAVLLSIITLYSMQYINISSKPRVFPYTNTKVAVDDTINSLYFVDDTTNWEFISYEEEYTNPVVRIDSLSMADGDIDTLTVDYTTVRKITVMVLSGKGEIYFNDTLNVPPFVVYDKIGFTEYVNTEKYLVGRLCIKAVDDSLYVVVYQFKYDRELER